MDARQLRVIGKDEPEKDRAEVQKTMLGPEVLDSERHQEIVFKCTGAEPAGPGWTLRGNLTLHGQTRPVTVQVTLKDGRYTGANCETDRLRDQASRKSGRQSERRG